MPVIDPKYTKGNRLPGLIGNWFNSIFKKKEEITVIDTMVPPAHKYDPLTFVTPVEQYYEPFISGSSFKPGITTGYDYKNDLAFGSLDGKSNILNYLIIGGGTILLFFILLKGRK